MFAADLQVHVGQPFTYMVKLWMLYLPAISWVHDKHKLCDYLWLFDNISKVREPFDNDMYITQWILHALKLITFWIHRYLFVISSRFWFDVCHLHWPLSCCWSRSHLFPTMTSSTLSGLIWGMLLSKEKADYSYAFMLARLTGLDSSYKAISYCFVCWRIIRRWTRFAAS